MNRFYDHPAFTAGYMGKKPEDLLRRAIELDAILCDIRYAPRSRNPVWNKEKLETMFGDRYRWVFAFGNKNYRGDGPIDIVDPDKGKEAVHRIIERQPVILLCVCPNYDTCHRKVVGELLRRDGLSVSELDWIGEGS